jgi:hypothetical protein
MSRKFFSLGWCELIAAPGPMALFTLVELGLGLLLLLLLLLPFLLAPCIWKVTTPWTFKTS